MLREKDVATEADGLAAAAGRSVETNRVLSRALLPESAANDLFAATDGQPAADHAAAADIAAKFRLVGVMLSGVSGPRRPMAIVEIRSDGHQKRLHEGDELEPHVRVATIERKEVWLHTPAGDVRLTRSDAAATPDPTSKSSAEQPLGEKTLQRFGGEQIAENRWRFRRDAILNYYRELLDRPERLVKVFDSLAPVYTDARTIEGYRVNIEGEDEFFAAVGLRQGDVIRSVNSLEMTNRRRAEMLIRRFAQNDLDTVIIELERDGGTVKQIYETE